MFSYYNNCNNTEVVVICSDTFTPECWLLRLVRWRHEVVRRGTCEIQQLGGRVSIGTHPRGYMCDSAQQHREVGERELPAGRGEWSDLWDEPA